MDDKNVRDDRQAVYEIGYLIAGVPEERVNAEADAVRGVITAAGASIIAEESPRSERLAYQIRKKTVSGSYDKYDSAHFGWVKFEGSSSKADGIKKAIEAIPSVLRMLLITTTRENTYLGKRAPAIAAAFSVPTRKPFEAAAGAEIAVEAKKEAVPAAPASPEEIDKSIDDMVKEA
jgi:ribosomal protein S6